MYDLMLINIPLFGEDFFQKFGNMGIWDKASMKEMFTCSLLITLNNLPN